MPGQQVGTMVGEPRHRDGSPTSRDESLGSWVHDPHILDLAGEHLPTSQSPRASWARCDH